MPRQVNRKKQILEFAQVMEPFTVYDVAEYYEANHHDYRRPLQILLYERKLFRTEPEDREDKKYYYTTNPTVRHLVDPRKSEKLRLKGKQLSFLEAATLNIASPEGLLIAKFLSHLLYIVIQIDKDKAEINKLDLEDKPELVKYRNQLREKAKEIHLIADTLTSLANDPRLRRADRLYQLVTSDQERVEDMRTIYEDLREQIARFEVDSNS